MSAEILNFGCRLNVYEGEVMRAHTAARKNLVVINTCAVTAEAERQARQAIRKILRENPAAEIVVTGCAAQIAPEKWQALPGVSRVVGNAEKLKAENWQADASPSVGDIMQVRETAAHLLTEFSGRARAFVQVQQGCDHRCTFCVIPFGRGPNRSVAMGAIADQVKILVAAGFQEIVLTGVDITSFGPDLPGAPKLGDLVRRLLAAVPDLPRLRLSSLDPAAIDEEFWQVFATNPRLLPHLHLSLQAADDMILKRMKRRHNVEQAALVIERARSLRPDAGIGADVIAGFPTESEEFFNNTADFLRAQKIPYLHVFPYSERPGTPAARMPAIPVAERRARAAILRDIGQQNAASFHQKFIGGVIDVLMEKDDRGHAAQFAPVRIVSSPTGLVRARVTAASPEFLTAEVIL
jgi:threonylcarbamoyladenosine tRNA methylthiotransferase MtaB